MTTKVVGAWCTSPDDEEYAHFFKERKDQAPALMTTSLCQRKFTSRAKVKPGVMVRQCPHCLERKG